MNTPQSPRRRSHLMAAVVLGTALSTFGANPGQAAETRAVTDISRYCTTCWRNARLHPDSWGDCTQEVFCRLLQRVQPDGWGRVLKEEGDERREFLRAIDAVKKRTQRARKYWGGEGLENVAERSIHTSQDEREAVERAAREMLSERQQRIVRRSLEGATVQDLAAELRLPAERVSDEKYKAIRKLRTVMVDTMAG